MHQKVLSSLIIVTLLLGASLTWEDTEMVAQQEAGASEIEPIRAAAPLRKPVSQVQKKIVTPAPKRQSTFLPIVDQKDIKEEHKVIADEALRLLPAKCSNTIKNFYVRYEPMGSRGYAGETTVILSGLVPHNEFRALLFHEVFGHVLDLGCLKGTAKSGPSEFHDGPMPIYRDDPSVEFYRISWINEETRKKSAKPADFISGYAYKSDAFEDLAESMTAYVLHQALFRERAKTNAALAEKLAWIEKHVFPQGLTVATTKENANSTIPWDTTKLPYIWKPVIVAKK